MSAELHELSSKDRVRAETTCQIRRDSSAGYTTSISPNLSPSCPIRTSPRPFEHHPASSATSTSRSTTHSQTRRHRPDCRHPRSDVCPAQAPTLPVSCPQEQGDRRRIRFFEPAFVACPSDIFSLASRAYQGVHSAAGNQAFPALPTGWYR